MKSTALQAVYRELSTERLILRTPRAEDASAIFEAFDDFEVSSLPHVGGVDVVITQRSSADASKAGARSDEFEAALRGVLGSKVYAVGSDPLEAVIGTSLAVAGATLAVADSQEVTILADKSVPFIVVRKVMSACTIEGYENVSLAVVQKPTQVAAN